MVSIIRRRADIYQRSQSDVRCGRQTKQDGLHDKQICDVDRVHSVHIRIWKIKINPLRLRSDFKLAYISWWCALTLNGGMVSVVARQNPKRWPLKRIVSPKRSIGNVDSAHRAHQQSAFSILLFDVEVRTCGGVLRCYGKMSTEYWWLNDNDTLR